MKSKGLAGKTAFILDKLYATCADVADPKKKKVLMFVK